MGGTLKGGKSAAATNKKKYGDDFYAVIGRKGGKVSSDGGFASNNVGKDGLTGRERASKYGVLGGKRSKRLPRNKSGV